MGYELPGQRTILVKAIEHKLTLPLMKPEDTHANLPTEVVELQRELAKERLRNKLLTAIIDIAE